MPEPLLRGDETAFLSTFCHSQPFPYTSEQALGGMRQQELGQGAEMPGELRAGRNHFLWCRRKGTEVRDEGTASVK